MSSVGPVYVVGAGRLGAALLLRWRAAGVAVAGAWSRTPAGAARASALLKFSVDAGPDPPTDLGVAEVVVLGVPDDAVVTMASALAASGALRPSHVLLHCAGALDASALAPAEALVSSTGSMHPLQTVSDPEAGSRALEGAWAACEGGARETAVELAQAAGLRPVRLRPGSKAAYHAAAVLACNDLVALFDVALQLMELAGVEREQGRSMLVPLVRATVDNLGELTPEEALTGPIRRGDVGSVRRHLEVVDGPARDVYLALGRAALALARRATPPLEEEALLALEALLSERRER